MNPYNGQVVVEATPSQDGISILVKRLNKGIKNYRGGSLKVISVKPKKRKNWVRNVYFILKLLIRYVRRYKRNG